MSGGVVTEAGRPIAPKLVEQPRPRSEVAIRENPTLTPFDGEEGRNVFIGDR